MAQIHVKLFYRIVNYVKGILVTISCDGRTK